MNILTAFNMDDMACIKSAGTRTIISPKGLTFIDKYWEAIASYIQYIKSLDDDVDVYVDNKYGLSTKTKKGQIGINSEMLWIEYGNLESRLLLCKDDLTDFEEVDDKYIKPEARLLLEDIFTFKKSFKLGQIEKETDFLTRY